MSISTMKKLTVLAYSSDADAIVRKLMDQRCVQIRHAQTDERGRALEERESDDLRLTTEARLSKIREALPALAKYSHRRFSIGRRVHRVDRQKFLADGNGERAMAAVEETLTILLRQQAIATELQGCDERMTALMPWLEYNAILSEGGSGHTGYVLGSCAGKTAPTAILEEAGAYVEVVSNDADGWYLALTYHLDDEDAVQRAMAECGFIKASFDGIDTTSQTAYTRLDRKRTLLEDESVRLNDRLNELAEQLDAIEILSDIEETNLNVCLQKQKLLRTRHCVVLEGWVPDVTSEAVVDALKRFECAVEIAEPDAEEEPPVLLHINRFSETFEWVIGLYSYPKFGSFDPTFIMSIFYFIIFGMMFADVGYGLLMVLACFGGAKLLNPKPGLKRMMLMFGYCGISCAVMGVLFGGWFGNLPTAIMNSFFPVFNGQAELTPIGHFFAEGLIFNPITKSTDFLVLALALGEIHLVAGLIVNMVLTWKKGSRLEAIGSTIPYLILFAGLDMLAPELAAGMGLIGPFSEGVLGVFAILSDVGLYVTIAGFASILLFKGLGQKTFIGWLVKGLGGLYSLISFASDLLSYSRILALGLVAGVIAQVINMMTGIGATGVFGFIFMVIIMVVGHVLNIAINLLGTFVHAARLQYIEFFGKFYEDGGEPFDPALPTEEYSEDIKESN